MTEPIFPEGGPTTRWRAVPAETLHFAHWEGQSVLFHQPSGRTHLLNEAMVVLLTRVLSEPRTAVDSFRELTGEAAVDSEESIEELDRVQDALGWLEELGLVERC